MSDDLMQFEWEPPTRADLDWWVSQRRRYLERRNAMDNKRRQGEEYESDARWDNRSPFGFARPDKELR